MNKIEELEEKIHAEISNLTEKFDKEISELKAELEQEEQEWIPQMNERYYYIDLDGMAVYRTYWANSDTGNIRLQRKLIFKTSDEAEEYLEYLKAKEKAMNEFSKEEWEDENIRKYGIYYDYDDEVFEISSYCYLRNISEMYFQTRESAQEFINKYEKYLRRELGV